MTEQPTERIEFSEQDLADLAILGVDAAEAPAFHPVLEVWREVLKPARTEKDAHVTPQWASRICSTYQQITFADMVEFRDRYFAKVLELARILDFEISTDDECLVYTTPEEDAEQNSAHYKNLLRDWQLTFLGWELAWDCTDPHAAVELATIGEVHRMFFGDTGLTQYLDNIRFEYTEADQEALAEAITEFRGEG